MYLTAIKSLLRYYDDVRVVVHDDGSLNGEDESLLRQHLPGVTYIDRGTADGRLAELLERYPHARALRARVVNSLELFDNMLLAPAPRIINMNSDVLFLREPRELIAWITGNDSAIVGVFEAEPAGQAAFLEQQGSHFPPHVTTALACLYPGTCDLEFVESVLSDTAPDWFTAQNVFPLLYERQAATRTTRFFDERSYQASGVFAGDAVFRHYWSSTGKFTDVQERDSRSVLMELASPR